MRKGDNRNEDRNEEFAEIQLVHEHLHDVIKLLESLGRKMGVITKKQGDIMATVADLQAKAEGLQATVDDVQAKVASSTAALQASIDELKAQIAAGASPEALQVIADELDSTNADLKSTFPETPPA